MKKHKLGVPKMKGGIIDYKKVEKRGSMGKFDMFEAGRKQARKMSSKYRKSHGRKSFKWTM